MAGDKVKVCLTLGTTVGQQCYNRRQEAKRVFDALLQQHCFGSSMEE